MKIHTLLLPLLAASLAFAGAPKGAIRPSVSALEHWPQLPEGSGFLLQPLAGNERAQVQLSLLTLSPGAEVAPTRAVGGQLVVYVLDGQASLPATPKEGPLAAGDAVTLGAGGSGLRNAGKNTLQALVIAAPPGRLTLEAAESGARPGPSGGKPVALHRAQKVKPLGIAGGRAEVRMLVEGRGAAVYVGTFRALPELVIPAHAHGDSTEVLFIRNGTGDLMVDGKEHVLGPGSVVFLPPGTEHAFRHTGAEPLEAVQIFAPPGPEERFRGGGAPPAPKAPGGGSITGSR